MINQLLAHILVTWMQLDNVVKNSVFGNQLEKAIHNLNKALLLPLFAVYIYIYSAIQKRS